MNSQDLINSILQLAMQGKLVEQREEEGTANELLEQIEEKRQTLIKEKIIKRQKNPPKISDDEKQFDIPESWKWTRLETVTYSIGNKSNQIKQREILQEGKYPVVSQSMNKIEGYSNEGSKLLSVAPLSVIVFGDHSKTIKLIDFDFIIGADGTKIMVPISLNPDFLYYVLKYNVINMRDRGYSRHFQFLKEKLIPLPPLDEQRRIVAKIEELMPYVDKYDKAYSEVEKLNKKFPDDMQRSILQYAIQGKLVEQREEEGTAVDLYQQIQEEKAKLVKLGKVKKPKKLPEITRDEIPFDIPGNWKWVRLADVSENIHYGYTASANEIGNCKLLRITDIQNNRVNWDSVPYCDVKDKDYLTYGLNNRDIMIARTGGTIGKTYIVESLNDRAVFASYLIRVVPVNSVNENYLKKFMESPLYWSQLKAGSMGTGQPNVNGTTLSKLVLPLPPLAEQERIVKEIEELSPYMTQLVK